MRRWAWRHLDWHEAVDSIIASEAAEFRAMATSAEPRSGTGSGVTTRVLGSAKAREVSTVKAVTAT
jgi:1,4-dihydroxy-2-naphthoyl-CoA synthase